MQGRTPFSIQSISVKTTWAIVAGLVTLAIIYFSLSHRHLYGDGANYFLQVLTAKNFFIPHYSRILATSLKEIFLVIAINLGVKNISLLSVIFGLNNFAPPVVGLGLSYLMIPEGKKSYFVFALTNFLFWFQNNSFHVNSEIHLVQACFWPIFFYFFFRENSKPFKTTIALLCSIVLISSYEAVIVILGLLSYSSLRSKKGMSVFIPLFVFGILLNLYWILYPDDPLRDSNWWYSIQFFSIFTFPPFWASVAILLILLWSSVSAKSLIQIKIGIALISALVVMGWPILFPELLHPNYQFRARLFNIIFPFGMASLVWWQKKKLEQVLSFPSWPAIITTTIFIFFQLELTFYWNSYLNNLGAELSSNHGIIKYSETMLDKKPSLAQFRSSWTLPTMSLLLQAISKKEVNTLIQNEREDIWQPWDPKNKNTWPDLTSYGIIYNIEGKKIENSH